MTTTESQLTGTSLETSRWPISRVLVGFIVGVLLVAIVAVGSVLAYEQTYAGKIASGVSVGGVDVTGLTREQAADKLEAAFASVSTGTLAVDTPTGPATLTYAELGRRPDIDTMLDQAFAVGRTGNPVERVVEEARTLVNKVNVAPRVAIDQAVLAATLATLAAKIDRLPTSASVAAGTDGYDETSAVWGREVDQAAMTATITEALAKPDAPSSLSVPLAVTPIAPAVTDIDAMIAKSRASRMVAPITLNHGKDKWTIADTAVRGWISFGLWPDGTLRPAGRSDEDRGVGQGAVEEGRPEGRRRDVLHEQGRRRRRGQACEGRPEARCRGHDHGGPGPAPGARRTGQGPVGHDRSGPRRDQAEPDDRGGRQGRPADAPDLVLDDLLPVGRPQRVQRQHLDPVDGDQRDRRRAGPVVQLLEGGRRGQPGEGLQARAARSSTGTRSQGAIGGGICSSSTTIFNAALRAGLQMGARQQPLLLHQPLSEGPRRDRLQGRWRRRPGHDLQERHQVPDPRSGPMPDRASSGSRSTACRPVGRSRSAGRR